MIDLIAKQNGVYYLQVTQKKFIHKKVEVALKKYF